MTGWRKRQVIELAERASPSKQDWWKDDDALEAFAKLVREDEREACAKVCDEEASTESEGEWMGCAIYLAHNIRERGQV